MHYGYGGAQMGWIWWLFCTAAIVVIVWAVARVALGPRGSGDSPEIVLKRRYAKGEIDRETYERMLAELRK